MKKAFKSSTIQDQQVVSKNSIPNPVADIYNQSDKPPPLNILTPYRYASLLPPMEGCAHFNRANGMPPSCLTWRAVHASTGLTDADVPGGTTFEGHCCTRASELSLCCRSVGSCRRQVSSNPPPQMWMSSEQVVLPAAQQVWGCHSSRSR